MLNNFALCFRINFYFKCDQNFSIMISRYGPSQPVEYNSN